MYKIRVYGYKGKVSKFLIDRFYKGYKNLILSSIYTKNNVSNKYKKFLMKKNYDCAIIFSNTKNSIKYLNISSSKLKPVILGTTGFNLEELKNIIKYSKYIPIIMSSNFNIEFYNIFKILKKININCLSYEIHNKKKKDSPSGSAFLIEKIMERKLYFTSIRYKKVLGTHKLIFFNKNNTFKIEHKIINKNCYLKGITKSVEYITKKKNGIHKFIDINEY
ncbi:dihydrodipicolinate reductase C-terminal domain-containing protein [Candidatus Vidania fulgoroideorum]